MVLEELRDDVERWLRFGLDRGLVVVEEDAVEDDPAVGGEARFEHGRRDRDEPAVHLLLLEHVDLVTGCDHADCHVGTDRPLLEHRRLVVHVGGVLHVGHPAPATGGERRATLGLRAREQDLEPRAPERFLVVRRDLEDRPAGRVRVVEPRQVAGERPQRDRGLVGLPLRIGPHREPVLAKACILAPLEGRALIRVIAG